MRSQAVVRLSKAKNFWINYSALYELYLEWNISYLTLRYSGPNNPQFER